MIIVGATLVATSIVIINATDSQTERLEVVAQEADIVGTDVILLNRPLADLKLAVVQVQQFLTDISSTGGWLGAAAAVDGSAKSAPMVSPPAIVTTAITAEIFRISSNIKHPKAEVNIWVTIHKRPPISSKISKNAIIVSKLLRLTNINQLNRINY